MNNIMSPFSFELPTKIEYGLGAVKRLPLLLGKLKIKRALIVTDKGVLEAKVVEKITDILETTGIQYNIFHDVDANPKDYNVRDGAKALKSLAAQGMIALGGGSPIDCAKSIGVLASHDGDSIKAYEGKTGVKHETFPLIAIPTTSGTGSEVTFSSVINDTKNNYKMTVKSPFIAAEYALLDPELTVTMPPTVTASTGIDALTHAIEAYTATRAEPISDALALYAIELIYKYIKNAVFNGTDIAARSGMLLGSLLAGMAFSHSDVASVHCIAESMGGIYDTPHGVCNSVLLPYVMEYNMDYCQERYARIASAMGSHFNSTEEGAKMAVQLVSQLSKDVNLPSFKSLGVKEGDFHKIAQMSVQNISTQSNPRPMQIENYIKVLENAYKG